MYVQMRNLMDAKKVTSYNTWQINTKSFWKCAHMAQAHIPPIPHPYSTINGQCKAPYECQS